VLRSRRTRPADARSRSRLLTVVLLVLGVAWMHTLAAAPLIPAPPAGAAMAVHAMPPCAPDGHHHPCPGDPRGGGHAAAMCQSALPPAIGAPPPTFTAAPAEPSASPVRTLTITVAAEAAGGSGCGPPLRSVLSIWRT
jgi:hypothetical protein